MGNKTDSADVSVAAPPSHTEGPWTVGCFLDPASKCQCSYIFDEGYAGAIAQICIDNGKRIGDGGNDCPPVDEARANARLIAAAPALLEALKAMTEEWVDYMTINNLGDPWAKHNMKRARTAISAATDSAATRTDGEG